MMGWTRGEISIKQQRVNPGSRDGCSEMNGPDHSFLANQSSYLGPATVYRLGANMEHQVATQPKFERVMQGECGSAKSRS